MSSQAVKREIARCDNCKWETDHYVIREYLGEPRPIIICWDCRKDCGVLFPEEDL